MNQGARIVAWLCISSTLFMGCYSSAIMDPAGPESGRMASDDIESLITKDRTKYVFDQPATLAKSNFIGISNGKQISIPMDNISNVYVTKPNVAGTVLLVTGVLAAAAVIYFLTTTGEAVHDAIDSINTH